MQKEIFDFVVVGSGIAGLNAALSLAKYGKVLIVTKKTINASSTFFAQGGIAAVTKKDDSIDSHVDDTLNAGYHHNKKDVVTFLAKSGKKAIEKLVDYGVLFDKQQDGDYVSSYEAAHSYPRILHATDFTGQEIQRSLVSHILANKNITIWEHTQAVDLIVRDNVCMGITVLRHPQTSHSEFISESHGILKQVQDDKSVSDDKILNVFSRCVVLATGGAGQLFQWTTNPSVAAGDGIAIAKRAGAKISDLEFIQFHPTALKGKTSQLFLLSEALRGEGAFLVDKDGKRFMPDVHPLAELAPRDVVARTIFEKQKTGEVFIDFRHKTRAFLVKRFPKITAELKKRGYDLSKDLIPVTPAAHFICGGITTDVYGRSSITNLFAYGEVAATGVHGANRLASNSLLEGIVFSSQVEKCINELPLKSSIRHSGLSRIRSFGYERDSGALTSFVPRMTVNKIKKQIRKIMWEHVGIIRTAKGLDQAMKSLKIIETELDELKGINQNILQARNMLTVAMEITKAAKNREYSLGTHSFING